MLVLVGSKNPGKIEGAKQAVEFYFENVSVEGVNVPSQVPDQPVNDDIYLGAKNRVDNLIKYAKENNIEADYYMGIESGITNSLGKWVICNVAVIKDKQGKESWGTSASFPVPQKYVDKIISTCLGEVMDSIFNEKALNRGTGGINLLSHSKISRIDLTREAFVMAMTQFINEEWNDFNEWVWILF